MSRGLTNVTHQLATFIEDDGVLFFLHKVPIVANRGHFFGLASVKIDMRGGIMETGCHSKIAAVIRP